MNVLVQVFNSLMACGMKLSLRLVVLVLMLQYRLPDGSRQNSLWLGWWGFLLKIEYAYYKLSQM